MLDNGSGGTAKQDAKVDRKHEEPKTDKEIAQDVNYKASVVSKVTDITSSMNVST